MHPNKAKKSTCNAKGRTRCRRKGLIGDTCIKSVMQNGVARLEARNIKRLSILVAIHHLDAGISLGVAHVELLCNQRSYKLVSHTLQVYPLSLCLTTSKHELA